MLMKARRVFVSNQSSSRYERIVVSPALHCETGSRKDSSPVISSNGGAAAIIPHACSPICPVACPPFQARPAVVARGEDRASAAIPHQKSPRHGHGNDPAIVLAHCH